MNKQFIILLFFFTIKLSAQSLTGMSGLFSIPSAEITNDARINAGLIFLDKKYLHYGSGKWDAAHFYLNISYLPFLEIGIRGTRLLKLPGNYTLDRMLNVKVQVIKEAEYLPAAAIGFNNPLSSRDDAHHFNSTFIVFSKNIFSEKLHFTIGYGSDIIKAADHQFIGFFGGVSLSAFPFDNKEHFAELLLEYDAERVNGGVRVTVWDSIRVLAGLMNFEKFSGGLSFSFIL